MKRTTPILTLALAALLLAAAEPAGRQLTVQVMSAKIRKEAKFWAPAVATAEAGQKVEEAGRAGAWVEVVTAAGARGWVHESAVTYEAVRLSGGSRTADRSTSTKDVSLAGKGFTEEVEEQYKAQNRELDFEAVDAMSALVVTDAEIEAFLQEGRLAQWGETP